MSGDGPLSQHHLTRSTPLVVGGLLATAGGLVAWVLGDRANLVAEIGGWGTTPGAGAVALGALVTAAGFGTLVTGVARLTTNIDLAAQVAAAKLAEDSKASAAAVRARYGAAANRAGDDAD